MNLDLLAIAAHPDDVELTCCDTLLKIEHAGYKTRILALTSRETGTTDTKRKVFLSIDRLEDEMNQLARHYGEMIGVRYGEPFLQKEMMKVNDVVEMEVRSI